MNARSFDAIYNDGGEGYNPMRHSKAAMMAEHRQTMAARQKLEDAKAAFEAEWTLEVTNERRAAWNAAVQAGEMTTAGEVDPAKVAQVTARLGYGLAELRRAKSIHSL